MNKIQNMNKIKLDVTIIIEDDETGKKTKKRKTMCLYDFVNMVCRDSPSEFDVNGGYGVDYDFYYMLLGMLIVEKEINYGVTDEDGNEKSVIAKLTNIENMLAVLK